MERGFKKMETNNKNNEYVRKVAEQKYEFGFTTDVHTDIIEKGLSEDVVRLISSKKANRNGSLNSVSRHSVTGQRSSNPHGDTYTFQRLTIRRYPTTQTLLPRSQKTKR